MLNLRNLVAFSFVLHIITIGSFLYVHNQDAKKIDACAVKVDNLKEKVAAVPKIATVDLATVAKQWAGEDDNIATKAFLTAMQFYKERGYLILDRAGVVSVPKEYELHMPSPSKMKSMLKSME